MSSPKGFPSNQKLDQGTGKSNNYTTVIPTDPYRNALDTPRFAFRVGSNTVPRTCGANTGNPSSGPTYIHDPSTIAKIGDIFRAEDGDAQFIEFPICQLDPNGDGFYLSARAQVDQIPASGDDFYILRSVTQRTDDDGTQFVILAPSPIAFEKDGNAQTVTQDTGTPANSEPLPIVILNPNGTEVTPATSALQSTGNASLSSIDTKLSSQATAAKQDTGNTSLAALVAKDFATESTLNAVGVVASSINSKTPALVGGSVPVTGPLTDSQLRATALPISASSLPLPTGAATEVTLAAQSAKLPATLGQKAMAASMSVALASDQSSIPVAATLSAETTKVIGTVNISAAQTVANVTTVGTITNAVPTKAPVNTSGANTDSTVGTVATLTAPANAVGFILMNLDTSSASIRWRIGATATLSAGQQLQAGRDTGFIPCAANISICAESGTQNYNVQWILSA